MEMWRQEAVRGLTTSRNVDRARAPQASWLAGVVLSGVTRQLMPNAGGLDNALSCAGPQIVERKTRAASDVPCGRRRLTFARLRVDTFGSPLSATAEAAATCW